MLLSALLLDTFDRCPRRYALEQQYQPRVLSPLALLYAGVEGGLLADDPCEGARDAVRALAATRDIDSPHLAAISCVRHVGLMAEVIALELRHRLGLLHRLAPMPWHGHEWQSALFEDKKGQLHRVILVAHVDDDVLRGFAHAWGTVGEMAVLERDLNLIFVAIGAQRQGRRHSHWTKGFRHPVQRSALRFAARKKANGFTSGWMPVWRDQTDIPAGVWLKQMHADDVLGDMVQWRRISYRPDDQRIERAKDDILALLPSLAQASPSSPMRRSSCDDPIRGACVFQAVCWTPAEAEELVHLYSRKDGPPSS